MKLPRVIARETTSEHLRLTLALDPELEWFAGHFPGHPVLPGVAQVGWAIVFARESFGFAADPLSIDHVKFLRPLAPGVTVTLELHRTDAAGRVNYRLSIAGELAGSGRLDFGSGGTP
ncbi:MAG: 3-hydroxyacyl-ACP dehydratase FabZ family protein [Gammaproteobacteria bacterium]